MRKFGPTRGEHIFRLAVSLVVLAFLGVVLALRGLPEGPGLIEIVVIPVCFLGGTAFLSIRALLRRDHG